MAIPHAVLVGPPGAGKSTIARRLARALDLPMTDTDEMIEKLYGKPCGEVFTQLGEQEFRAVETTQVQKALQEPGIISLGGGAVTTDAVRELLNDHTVIWLDVSAEEGTRRTQGNNSRPVLEAANPLARYEELLSQRKSLYSEVSDYRIRTDKRSPQQTVADILGVISDLDDSEYTA